MFKKHTASGLAALSQHCNPHPHLLTDRQISRFSAGDHDPLLKIKNLTDAFTLSGSLFFFCGFHSRSSFSVRHKSSSRAPWSCWFNRHLLVSFSPQRHVIYFPVHALMMVSSYSVYVQWHPDLYLSYCGEKKALISHRSKMFVYNSIATST